VCSWGRFLWDVCREQQKSKNENTRANAYGRLQYFHVIISVHLLQMVGYDTALSMYFCVYFIKHAPYQKKLQVNVIGSRCHAFSYDGSL
jgi:hypothetical protein